MRKLENVRDIPGLTPDLLEDLRRTKTYTEIGVMFHISEQTIRRLCRKYEITVEPPKPHKGDISQETKDKIKELFLSSVRDDRDIGKIINMQPSRVQKERTALGLFKDTTENLTKPTTRQALENPRLDNLIEHQKLEMRLGRRLPFEPNGSQEYTITCSSIADIGFYR